MFKAHTASLPLASSVFLMCFDAPMAAKYAETSGRSDQSRRRVGIP